MVVVVVVVLRLKKKKVVGLLWGMGRELAVVDVRKGGTLKDREMRAAINISTSGNNHSWTSVA
jgi:hypothetical protein